MIGPAAAADDRDAREARPQSGVVLAELGRIAVVQLVGLVELGVALRRGVRAQAADPLDPRLADLDRVREMRGVRAVDHEVGGGAVRLGVDLLDRITQRLAARQAAVGLDREGDGDRDPGGCGGLHDPAGSSA